jgi:hypothetical protein
MEIEIGKLEYEIQEFNLEELLNEVLNLFKEHNYY